MSPTWMMAGLSPLIWMTGGVVELTDSGEVGVGFWSAEEVTDSGVWAEAGRLNRAASWVWVTQDGRRDCYLYAQLFEKSPCR